MASTAGKTPPPLPPRQSSAISTPAYEVAPPSYDSIAPGLSIPSTLESQDPRSSSAQSLPPPESSAQGQRRKLLLIYVHGFMGDETSFRSFPAHVHNLLTILLSSSHVVHTKIYPRYRSKRNISFARDDFSKWLEPHESASTDVVLLGHSMGGLLAAEVVLMAPPPPANRPFKHRILGTINFDVPFLGMHPGVVRSGLASIFNPPDESPGDKYPEPVLEPMASNSSTESAMPEQAGSLPPRRSDTLWMPERQDPNFNPSFANDVVLPMRKGWRNGWHFINKHSSELTKATKQLVTSHLEFGGAMANYGELKARYARIRALEEENENVRKPAAKHAQTVPRVRFTNYYTASTGRPKKPSRTASPETKRSESGVDSSITASAQNACESSTVGSRMSVEEHQNDDSITKDKRLQQDDLLEDEEWEDAAETLRIGDAQSSHRPPKDLEDCAITSSTPNSFPSRTNSTPPLPELPSAPPPLDVSFIQDKSIREAVEKEHAHAVEVYERAVKEREKIFADRSKHVEQRKKEQSGKAEEGSSKAEAETVKPLTGTEVDGQNAEHEQVKPTDRVLTHQQSEELRLRKEMLRMETEARRLRGEPEPVAPLKPANSLPQMAPDTRPIQSDAQYSSATDARSPARTPSPERERRPHKDRKFCTLPSKDSHGQRDPCWVRVFMENVDEVGAHCGLFFVDQRYERLVGDVAERIESWVQEDLSQRAKLGKS